MKAALRVVDTPQSRWTDGLVHGLGDRHDDALVLDIPLSAWRGRLSAVLGAAPWQLVLGGDTWLDERLLRALLRAVAGQPAGIARLARAPGGPGGYADPLSRLPRDDLGRILFDVWLVPASMALPDDDDAVLEALSDAAPIDVEVRSRTTALPADPEVLGSTELPLTFGAGACGPVGHWAELLRMNLLACGGALLADTPLSGLLRYLWGGLRALSLNPDRVGQRLNRMGSGCRVHPSAVVELSTLGDRVRVGAGAIVRHAVLADDVEVGPQAIVDLSVVGERARVQRRAMLTASVAYPGARVGGIVQLGVCGRDSATKMFAVGTDMKLSGKVATPTPDGLREIDIAYLGVCFGHRSFVGSGVWIGPGRVVPADARIARPRDQMVLKPAAVGDAGVGSGA